MKCQIYKVKSQNLKKSSINLAFLLKMCCFVFLFFAINTLHAFAVDVLTDDIYRVSESNGIATAICKAIDMGTFLMTPLFAIMFTILGFGAFQGNLKWSVFVTFTLGMAAFKGAGSIAEIFMPKMGLQYGCNCAIEKHIRDEEGNVKIYATGLNLDCSEGIEDYLEQYAN